MVAGLIKRAIISEPMITPGRKAQIKAPADPKATHSTYSGFAPCQQKGGNLGFIAHFDKVK